MMFKDLNKKLTTAYMRHRKKEVFIILLWGLLSNLLTIAIPISIGKYYELVFGFTSHRLSFLSIVPENLWATPRLFLLFFLTIIVFRYLFFYFFQYKLRYESARFIKKIKDNLFEEQQSVKYNIYKEKGIGKYLLRYTGDINSLRNLFQRGSIIIIVDVIIASIAFILLLKMNVKGSLVILASSAMGYFVIRWMNIHLENKSLKKRNKTSNQVAFVNRILSTMISVKIFNRSDIEVKRYSAKSKKVFDATVQFNKWFVINKGFISFLQYITLFFILIVFLIDNETQAHVEQGGVLVSFILLYVTIMPTIRRIYSLESVLKLGRISERKLKNILMYDRIDDNKGINLKIDKPELVFKNFSHQDGIEKINYKVQNGQLNFFKLPPGISPNKFINFLTNLDTGYNGEIFINKVPIEKVSPNSLRNIIGVASKEYPLIGKSVYEALVKKRVKAEKHKVELLFNKVKTQCLNNSNLSLDSSIGENGSNLLDVEYELIALVRGLCNNNKLIILDAFPLLEGLNDKYLSVINKHVKATIIKLE